jgi:hypothetical protein
MTTLILCSWSITSWSHEPPKNAENPHVWKPKTQSVSVFKNGFGFFTREGTVALQQGWGHATEVPPATFGTLALFSKDPKQVVDVVGVGDGEVIRFDGIEQPDTVAAKESMIAAAMASVLKIQYRENHQDLEAQGVVKSLSGGYVVLQQGATAAAVPVEAIRSIQRTELPLRFHVVRDQEQPAESANLSMSYLRSGIVWVPEYTLKIIDGETAELTLRGTLVNEAEDLIDCDVNFVVGVPHFVHTALLSPLAAGHAIRVLGSAMPGVGVPQQVMSQVMNRAAIANDLGNSRGAGMNSIQGQPETGDSDPRFAELIQNLPQMESVGGGDYSVYTKKGLTVRRGERAVVTLMSKVIRYGHKYHWVPGNEIEHRLTLENQSQTPWTTGPCLALSGTQPLSEDVLKYTPVGSRGELTVTTAINIAKQQTEEEADRKLKAHEPQPHQFLDLVTIDGELKLRSYEKSPVEVRIVKSVNGKPIIASHDGTLMIDSEKLRLVERNGTIEWNVTLEPGKEMVLEYSYERFVPSF